MSIRLANWIYNKAEQETAGRAVRFCELYYGPKPTKPRTDAPEHQQTAYLRNIALWTAGQDMIDALTAELVPTYQSKEVKTWTTGKRFKELLTDSKRIVVSIRSGVTNLLHDLRK